MITLLAAFAGFATTLLAIWVAFAVTPEHNSSTQPTKNI